MAEMDLRDLARSHGRTFGELGITPHAASYIACGHHRARSSTIGRIAKALGIDAQIVASACDISWNRSHPTSPPSAINPGLVLSHPSPSTAEPSLSTDQGTHI